MAENSTVTREAACLSCRLYDPKPGLAGDLDEHYGLCRWALPAALPQVMLQHDLVRAATSVAARMIPKRGLTERPDLWADCAALAQREAANG